MRILQLFGLLVLGAVAGLAAGIVFVFACAAAVGDGMQPGAPAWAANLADLFWLPPLVGVVLAGFGSIVLWRRLGNRGGPPS